MPKSPHHAKKLLKVIHSDVCGPMQSTTFSGKRYFVTFTDEYSHFTIIFLLRNKSEVVDKFAELVAFAETQTGKVVLRHFDAITVENTHPMKWPSSVSRGYRAKAHAALYSTA